MRRLAVAVVLLVTGCADARDVFTPYHPEPAEVAAVLAMPRADHYDAALVFGCPARADGSASNCERCRVKSAVRLYRRGVIGRLVFSGAAAHSPYVEADVMGDLAVRRGVPQGAVLREDRALTTWENVRFGKEILDRAGARTTLFISTADHLPRVRRIAHFYGYTDANTGYFACDRDPPPDSDEEWLPKSTQPDKLAD